MLSILIPTYNYNVVPLVCELKKQIDELKIEYDNGGPPDEDGSSFSLLTKDDQLYVIAKDGLGNEKLYLIENGNIKNLE